MVDVRRVKLKKDTGGDVNPITKRKSKAKRRCRHGIKSVNATCVTPLAVVQVQIPQAQQDDLGFARDYLVELPQRIKEVQQAANAVLKAGRAR